MTEIQRDDQMAKREYTPSTFRELGTLRDLTAGSSGTMMDMMMTTQP